MIRVVFDTNVLFSAALKRTGVPAQTLDLVADRILAPCVSNAVMAEYFEVLTRPVLHPHAARVRELLAVMTKFAEHASPTQRLSLCSDSDDDCFLECALSAKARYLVTGNVRHFPKNYEQVAIVTPRQLLNDLIAESHF